MHPLKLLTEVCSIPTAPFAEQNVVRYVERFVAARPKLKLSRDRHGNRLIELRPKSRGRAARRPRWVFGVHMDHPGFVADRQVDPRTLEARFHGWFHIDYVRGTRVRFFDDGAEVTGVVTDATADTHDRLTVPKRVAIRLGRPAAVKPGSPGMFDQGAGRVRGKRFLSRGIDDQGGVAAALAMLDTLHEDPPPSRPVAVLLTRAEEDGFTGAIAAAQAPKLLRRTDRVISIECSAMQPYAPHGQGVIIRVGDKTSVFHSGLTYFLSQQAEQLAKRDKTFAFHRELMPGGTCEASVYDAYGYTAAAVCVALGNYHNMDRARQRVGPEYIDIDDWDRMRRFIVHLARTGHEYTSDNSALRERVTRRYEKLKQFL